MLCPLVIDILLWGKAHTNTHKLYFYSKKLQFLHVIATNTYNKAVPKVAVCLDWWYQTQRPRQWWSRRSSRPCRCTAPGGSSRQTCSGAQRSGGAGPPLCTSRSCVSCGSSLGNYINLFFIKRLEWRSNARYWWNKLKTRFIRDSERSVFRVAMSTTFIEGRIAVRRWNLCEQFYLYARFPLRFPFEMRLFSYFN